MSHIQHSENHLDIVLKEIAAGKEKAIEDFYHSHYNNLIKFGQTITQDRPAVEDAIQNLLIWLIENPRKIRRLDRADIYFYRALRNNLIKDQIQARKNIEKEVNETISQLLITESPEKNWMDKEEEQEITAMLQAEIRELPDYLQQTLYLRYFSDLPYKDISEILEVKPNVARIYVHRAIERLRSTLQKLQPLLGPVLLTFFYR